MEIVKIKIENFKSFDSEEITINKNINHFIGINGVGKSNFLKAVELFGNEETDFEKNARDLNKDIDIWFHLKLNSDDAELFAIEVLDNWLNYFASFLSTSLKKEEPHSKINIKLVSEFQNRHKKIDFPSDYSNNLTKNYLIKMKEFQSNWLLEKDFNYIHFVGIFQKYFKENELIFVKKIFKNKEDFVILTSNTNEIFYSSIFEIKESFLGEMNVFLEGGISQDGYNLANFLNSFLDINYKQGIKWDIKGYKYDVWNNKSIFKFNLKKFISVITWNKGTINLNMDEFKFVDDSNNKFLNNLLNLVDSSIQLLSKKEENDIYLSRIESALKDKVNNSIIKHWKDFGDERLEVSFKITNKSIKIILNNIGEHNQRDIGSESEGFKQFLSIMLSLDLNQINKNTILVIDEPEMHLHPSSVISLRNLLKKASKNYLNFFIATHSVQMIDKDNLETLNLVTKVNQNTKIINIVENEEKMEMPDILKQAFGTDIFSEFLFKKYTFFVEGKSDKVFFEKVIKEHNISANILIYYGSRGIDFIESIKGNFYQDYFENNCFFISDGDEEGIDFQDKLKDKFKNIKSFTLSEMTDSKEPLVIENFYSENLLNKYEKGKKKISENWKVIKDKSQNNESFNLEKAKTLNYDKPLKELKIKLSEEVEKSIVFEEISDKGNIEKLITFLKEQGIITT